jgi:hypothetical protein
MYYRTQKRGRENPKPRNKQNKNLKITHQKFLDFIAFLNADIHQMTMNLAKEAAAQALGFHASEADRLHKNGASYGVMKRRETAEIHFSMTNSNGTPPSIKENTKEARVSWKLAKKVVQEFE